MPAAWALASPDGGGLVGAIVVVGASVGVAVGVGVGDGDGDGMGVGVGVAIGPSITWNFLLADTPLFVLMALAVSFTSPVLPGMTV